MHLYELPALRALPLVFSFAIIVHSALETLGVTRPSLSPRMTRKDATKVRDTYRSSVIMLSFAFLVSMFVPMTTIVVLAMCSMCSMVYVGKNIADYS